MSPLSAVEGSAGGALDGGVWEMVQLMLRARTTVAARREEIYVYPVTTAIRQQRPQGKIPDEVHGQLALLRSTDIHAASSRIS